MDAVVFDEAEKIIASKFSLQTQNMRTVSDEVQTMLDIRKIADESDLNVTVKADPFKFFDQVFLFLRSFFAEISIVAEKVQMHFALRKYDTHQMGLASTTY